ncbi:pentatricopeptide repeat-containing protein At1g77405-like [Euphorbia lathyris]|uniref:pentatricopeptide repeat-containing protein At1g77405-like n=1 Tax=Euphorbia lathyris TaxID=212925 RepID=UPI00331421DF
MITSNPPHRTRSSLLVNQVLSIMIQNRPFDTQLASALTTSSLLTADLVSDVLRSIPRFFFQSTRSIGRQITTRHRSPLRQRNLKEESEKYLNKVLILGPAAYRDPQRVNIGMDKAMEFFDWVETHFELPHTEMTCKEMACVLARGNRPEKLWHFLRELTIKERVVGVKLITTNFITCLIKILGEEGLVNQALALFYRMKQYHCKPDVYAYNTIIYALCRVGNFKKARFLLEQMELPGFRCPPDIYTYTILISSYCKYSQQTGCRKAIRKRLWEANHLFRIMLFNGFVPDVVTYNCLIDGCCKTYRIERALELFEDMNKRGCVPNRVTYNSFIRYYSAVNEIDKAVEMLRKMQTMNHGLATSSSYTPIIHAMCESRRVLEAQNLLVELVDGGSVPREYTYKLVCDAMKSVTEGNSLLDDEFHERIKGGIEDRYKQVKKIKPIMAQKMLKEHCVVFQTP